MPVFKYLIKNNSKIPEYIEVEHSSKEPPLKNHPLTGEPIERVLHSPSLTLNHSEKREKNTLSPDHLEKHGFSILEKDTSSQKYIQTVGKNPKLDFQHGKFSR